MTIWRPAQSIKVKALGLHWRDGRLLAADVWDDSGRIKGVRPLGGSLEFGESWDTALRREFQEELGLDIAIDSPPFIMENIYTHHGETGHEVLFVATVSFPDAAFAGQDEITFFEDNGTACVAHWHDLNELDCTTGPALFPTGLKTRLLAERSKAG